MSESSETWAAGDACEVAWFVNGKSGEVAWSRGVVTATSERGVTGDYDAPYPLGCKGWHYSPGLVSRGLRRPTAPAETPHPDGCNCGGSNECPTYAAGLAPQPASRWPTTCACGSPAYVGLHARECSLGEACPIVAAEPEPYTVARAWLTNEERGWIAIGHGASVEHPLRDGAIAAWRERVRGTR